VLLFEAGLQLAHGILKLGFQLAHFHGIDPLRHSIMVWQYNENCAEPHPLTTIAENSRLATTASRLTISFIPGIKGPV
jgi:hypothetical protein